MFTSSFLKTPSHDLPIYEIPVPKDTFQEMNNKVSAEEDCYSQGSFAVFSLLLQHGQGGTTNYGKKLPMCWSFLDGREHF